MPPLVVLASSDPTKSALSCVIAPPARTVIESAWPPIRSAPAARSVASPVEAR